jgi:hypothetical protein
MTTTTDGTCADSDKPVSLLAVFLGLDQADAARKEIADRRWRDMILFRSAFFTLRDLERNSPAE